MLQIEPHDNENIEEHVVNLENELNITLPEDYKQFLTKYNGGWTPNTHICLNNLEPGINGFLGVGNAPGAGNFKYYMNSQVLVIKNEFYRDLRNGYLTIASWFGAYYYLAIKPELDNYGAIYFMDEDREEFIYVCSSFKELTQKAITPDYIVRTPEENIKRFKDEGREEEITPQLIKAWGNKYQKRKDVKLVPVIID